MLKIDNLHVQKSRKEILKGINLKISSSQIHLLLGPNGSGKSTLAKAIMGHPDYKITKGKIYLNKKDITNLATHKKAQENIFCTMQYPIEIPGVNFSNFLRLSYNSIYPEKKLSAFKFKKFLRKKLKLLNFPENFMERNLNEGFSGGEKKKAEILQLALLEPKYVILDETDSGLDVDSIKIVFSALKKIINKNPQMAVLVITHYEKILKFISCDKVHVLRNGKIIKNGGKEIVKEIHQKGFTKS